MRTSALRPWIAGLAIALGVGSQAALADETARFLILGHDGPRPAIWMINVDTHAAVKLMGKEDGLTGVWGLTVSGDKMYWTHKPSPDDALTTLFSRNISGGTVTAMPILPADAPIDISGLGFYSGFLYGTGESTGWTNLGIYDANNSAVYVSSSTGSPSNTGLTPADPLDSALSSRSHGQPCANWLMKHVKSSTLRTGVVVLWSQLT
jgi:hypothetical protein